MTTNISTMKITTAAVILVISAALALKRGGYRIVMEAYRQGGGGISLWKPRTTLAYETQRPDIRIASIDKHLFYDPTQGKKVDSLHVHCGATKNQRKLHRTLNYPFGVEKATRQSDHIMKPECHL